MNVEASFFACDVKERCAKAASANFHNPFVTGLSLYEKRKLPNYVSKLMKLLPQRLQLPT